MTTLDEIKTAIAHLSEGELRQLRDWYEQFDAELWDAQIEEDVHAGRLDALAEQAIKAFHNADTNEL